jgi:hypothetical protein
MRARTNVGVGLSRRARKALLAAGLGSDVVTTKAWGYSTDVEVIAGSLAALMVARVTLIDAGFEAGDINTFSTYSNFYISLPKDAA